ncbi:DNA-directed DNA polymerase [Tanacetum coccineum]
MMASFFRMNIASSLGTGSLPSNTVANPRAKTLVNENCLAVILKKLPEKLGDPSKFLIPCDFPELVECLALADLGASINLMPLSIWKKLSLLELTPTQMILELANRSTTSPSGIPEDVFVKVGKFQFPADFVVVDYVVDPRVPLILERPFLRTARALIDVYGEELTLRVDDEAITFKVGIDDAEFDPEGDIRLIEEMLNNDPHSPLPLKELKCEKLKSVKSSVDEPPKLELKDLPSYLEYAFLEGTNKLPIIIAKNFKDKEKERLIKVLKPHKQAIAWKLSEIKVIKKEVVKLLDAGLIYPISDSPWVNPVHYVPKKGRMTIVTNEDNELIPTRFPKCLMAIFHDMIEEIWKSSWMISRSLGFLLILPLPFRKYSKGAKTHIVLNWRNAFSWSKRHCLGHKIMKSGIKVDWEKCSEAFETLKKKLIEAPILVSPDWDLPFEIMCDASDFVARAVLGQRKTKQFQPIHYESKTMTDAQAHYTTTEKELLAVVYAFEKF